MSRRLLSIKGFLLYREPKDADFSTNLIFSDRDRFIVYFLAKGLEEQHVGQEFAKELPFYDDFKYLKEPLRFSSNLLNWAKKLYEIEDEDIVELVARNVVCINGKCINISEIGSHCCIFWLTVVNGLCTGKSRILLLTTYDKELFLVQNNKSETTSKYVYVFFIMRLKFFKWLLLYEWTETWTKRNRFRRSLIDVA